MSNVFRRNRGATVLEFMDNAGRINESLTRFLMNEKNVPKSYRFMYTFPICGIMHSMKRNIVSANSTFPVNDTSLAMRREYQQKAINDCESIIDALQDMIEVLTGIDVDKLEPVGKLLIQESALLRAWRKNAKVQKSK